MLTIQQYLENYAKASLGDSADEIAKYYSHDFMVADPSGSQAYKNDEAFLQWLEGVIKFNKQTGMQDLKVLEVTTTAMGSDYLSARVKWGSTFKKTGDKVIPFEITYMLHKEADSYKIILYVSHENQQEVMQEYGLI